MHAFLNKFHSEMDKIIKDHNNCESRRKAKANKSKNCERRKNQENESDRASQERIMPNCPTISQGLGREKNESPSFHRGQTPPK
jgi:hypothetical protein